MASGGLAVSVLVGLAAVTGLAHAQPAGSSGLSVVPRVGLTQTWTDNLQSDSSGGSGIGGGGGTNTNDAALMTVLAPGINIVSRTGRVTGSLDYALNSIFYLKTEQKNRTQQVLSANMLAELLENTLFLDSRASISQQARSAFGQQSADSTLANANRDELASLTLSPYLRGRLAGLASVELRGNLTETNMRRSALGDSRSAGGSLNISSAGGGSLGWWATASSQSSSYKLGVDSRSTSTNVGLRYRPDTDLQLGLSIGRERSDLLGSGDRNLATYGFSGQWTPSPRTTLLADWQKHDYGNSHSLSFDHRMARSAWRLLDAQSVLLGNGSGAGGVRSNYDLLFLQFASQEPDPVRRDALVRSSLQSLGLSPDAVSTAGFISASPTLQRRREFSFSLQGLRTTLTALLSRSNSVRLGAATTAGDDFAQSTRIVQRSTSLSAAHRLTPQSNASISLSEQRSSGDAASQTTNLRSIIANWSSRLGPKITVSLGARHSSFDGLVPYTENAVFANLVQQF